MYRYCGKSWTTEELSRIRELIACHPEASRARLSQLVCAAFEWRCPNGKPKEMSCRVAMLRMQRDGLIELPAPRQKGPTNYKVTQSPDSDPQTAIVCSLHDLHNLRIQVVERGAELRRWSEFVGRHHYLGYKLLPGAQIRYFIMDSERVLGAMGFGAAAWKIAPRDNFIGWTHEERERGLHLIVGQSRFLILPWVQCRNLASKSLAMVTRRLADDWEVRYGFRPVLLETFVDITRFHGTCYKASNWINVGNTQGRGKLDRFTKRNQPVKSIWLQPLAVDFRRRLKRNGS